MKSALDDQKPSKKQQIASFEHRCPNRFFVQKSEKNIFFTHFTCLQNKLFVAFLNNEAAGMVFS